MKVLHAAIGHEEPVAKLRQYMSVARHIAVSRKDEIECDAMLLIREI
jgi:hypothetical protein